jgi:hypothetical protein
MNASNSSITRVKGFSWLTSQTARPTKSKKTARAVPAYVIVNPLGSVLVLTDFTGTVFDRDAVRAVKETAVFDRPFC